MGFAHGYFQTKPIFQGHMIVVLDFISIVAHCICWSAYKSRIYSLLLLIYYLFRLLFDILVLNGITMRTSTLFIETYVIGMMALLIIFMFFWNIFCITKKWLIHFASNPNDRFD